MFLGLQSLPSETGGNCQPSFMDRMIPYPTLSGTMRFKHLASQPELGMRSKL
jgi:hypothetical protein